MVVLAAAAVPEPSTSIMTMPNGAIVGTMTRTIAAAPEGRVVTERHEIRARERHHGLIERVEIDRIFEDRAGRVVRIVEESGVGADAVRTEIAIAADQATVVRTSRTGAQRRVVALPPGIRFDSGAGLLAAWNPLTDPPLAFDNFSAAAMAVERVTIAVAPGAVPTADGRIAVIRRRFDGDQLRGLSRLILDSENRPLSSSQPMFGTVITTAPGPPPAADRTPPLVDFDLVVPSPFVVSETAKRGHIRYRFAYRNGLAFDLPRTGEQRVTTDGTGATVDICGACGPSLTDDTAARDDALRATPWLQADAPALRRIADPVARMRISDAKKMERLGRIARKRLEKIDYVGHYSALDALKRGAGDCTEDAVLLAALARAAGIPARVANGLVYSRARFHGTHNAFMPHSWVIAWADGRWQSFHMTMGSFDATHIALTLGDGDARSVAAAGQLAGLLDWKSMAEVRASPSSK